MTTPTPLGIPDRLGKSPGTLLFFDGEPGKPRCYEFPGLVVVGVQPHDGGGLWGTKGMIRGTRKLKNPDQNQYSAERRCWCRSGGFRKIRPKHPTPEHAQHPRVASRVKTVMVKVTLHRPCSPYQCEENQHDQEHHQPITRCQLHGLVPFRRQFAECCRLCTSNDVWGDYCDLRRKSASSWFQLGFAGTFGFLV
jgi:hypothetical protein